MKHHLHAIIIIAASALLLAMSACQNSRKPTQEANKQDTVTQENTPNQRPTKAETDETFNTTDARAFGLHGYVKEVITSTYEATLKGNELVRGKLLDEADSRIAFNRQGLVTADPYFNTYEYDDKGNFRRGLADYSTMERDAQGRIATYDHQQDEEDDQCHHHTFHYDSEGRITRVEMSFYESTYTQAYTFRDDDIWPMSQTIEGMDEGNVYRETTSFRYTRVDNEDNWTEREVRSHVMEAEEDPANEGLLTNKKEHDEYRIQTRSIKYY